MMAQEKKIKERKIVVAVDESEESMYALSWCLANLVSLNTTTTTLILLYAKPPPPVYSSFDFLGRFSVAGYFFAPDVVEGMEKYARELANSVMSRAEEVYRHLNPTIKVEKRVGSGDAKDVICAAVENLGADMLVMGSHGYGFLKRAVLGSVSNHCAKTVRCPVVVVKRPKNAPEF
ncbi:hypothetical protein NMG60_11013763 [Bertholletia excelsa]